MATRGESNEPLTDREGKSSVVAEYTIDIPNFRELLDAAPGIRLTLEGEIACDLTTVTRTLWAEGGDFDAFETALEHSPVITDATALSDRTEGQKLYQVRLPATETTYWTWVGLDAVLLDGVGTREGWTVRMLFPDRDALVTYRNHCKDEGISFSLKALTDGVTPSTEPHSGLTDCQHELLAAAFKNGHFEVPREISLSDLAARFNISDQAASERMRRGLSNILQNNVAGPASRQPKNPIQR